MGTLAENLVVAAPAALSSSIDLATETKQPFTSSFIPQATENSAMLSESLSRGPAQSGPVIEKHYRSLLKAICWRATGTLDTIVISFLVTGKIKLAVSIGFVEVFTKIGLFYLHERLWNNIPLGRIKARDDYTI